MSKQSLPGGNVLMVTGVFMVVFGLLAVFSPAATGGAVVKIIALLLLVAGVVRLVQAYRSRARTDTLMSAVLGAVFAGLGILVWLNPEVGSGFLTALLMVFFVAHGLWKISSALRYKPLSGWLWLLLSGVLSLIFAWLMWQQWPLSGAWAIGILVGLDLLITGVVTILLALAVKRARGVGSLDTINL
jgi:uncharacterized membrane protein HdeD (DUF308 family)